MPITGTQPALTEDRVGMMRLGGSRLGYVLPIPYVTIDDVVRTSNVRVAGASIRDILNGTPNTATMRVDGFTPTEGHEVVLNFGVSGPTQFRGRILSTTKLYEGKPANVAWDCSCISEELLLNKTKVTRRYLSTSATAIILDLISAYAPGFSSAGVASGLPSLDEITFTSEDVTDCLDRICQRIGEDWQLDYERVLHVPAADGMAANAITDSDDHGMSGIAVSTDLSQVRTRQSGEGGGSNTSTDIAVGQTTMPIDDTTWYPASGGAVVSGPQRIPYTSKSTMDGLGSTVAGTTLSPGTPSAAIVAGTAGKLDVGAYQYKAAFVLPAGESDVSSASSSATISAVTAPSAPSGTQTSGVSGNLTVGNYGYQVTYETAAGETVASSASGSVAIGDISAPSAPSGAVVSEAPGNLRAGVYGYKTTYHTPAGETVASSASSGVTIPTVTAPGAPTTTPATVTGGGLTDGYHTYKVTYLTAAGETAGGTASTNTELTGGPNAFALTNIPLSTDDRVIGRRIYRTPAGGGGGSDYKYVGQLTDNLTTTFTDVIADASRGAVIPVDTSGTGKITVTIPTSADARVTKRSIYRTEVGGSTYYLLTTVTDNTDTSFVDNIADELLGGIPPSVGSAGTGRITVTIPTSSDGRVTKRSLYRTAVGGSDYKQIATIGNNTDTSFADNVPDTSRSEPEPATNTAGSGQIAVSSVPLGPAGTTDRRIYRTEAGGTVFKFLRLLTGNVSTSFTDNAADSSLGEAAPVGSTVGALAGATSLRVKDLALHPAAGWVRVGEQLVRYTGRSGSSGEGTLTGIPASGAGSIGAGLAANVSVVNHPHLTGVTGILYPITQGEPVNIWVTRNDTAAQAFMASALTTASYTHDGIIEADPIQDRRMSETEITARCDAKLEELSTPLVSVRYQTRDVTTRSGRTVTVTLAAPISISGTFSIQSVTMSGFSANGEHRPLYQVECSSRLLTFEQILRIRKAV